ncbi:serine/threonine-protein kinase TAO1-like isoform X2 [Liolophura sinensis]|uniref:serine/threonine-protein kinase TAO1-like isoform X2 n=1 Tax=Liolophura sinensis TaxID=3198878 RepID=UPI0031583F98
MPSRPRAGNLKDPEVAALFSIDDPEKIFTDLREIGHGSFGAVYFARNTVNKEIVAIKKMSYNGRQSEEKWQDIIKEVKFLRELKHKNTIDYKGCYLKDHTAWLVMEYCLGSASDIIEVHKKPLREDEIGAICKDALEGLCYLHEKGKIHRDIKAGNILLTENGTVKLADFGSASLLCPANSFVGTPYWMAPEVILAMDEGQYDGKADVWSMGITCIELAERKPPLFNMNAMSALYHIAQNDSPTLSSGEWSDDFRHFVDSCLAKNPSDRPDALELMSHDFIKRTYSGNVILDLIQRTKDAVRELDNLQYKRMKKILMVDTQGIDNNGPPEEVIADDSSQDEPMDDGSKSNSVASQQSFQSTCRSVSSHSSSMNSLPGAVGPDGVVGSTRDKSPSSASGGRSVDRSNFATIRTTSIVTKQIMEHEHENELREQFTGYKRMRRQHQKQLQQMESKFKAEMEDHKCKLDREYETLRFNFQKELDRLRVKHQQDLDKRQKTNAALEKRKIKQLQQAQDVEMKAFQSKMKRDYRQNKEQLKKDMDNSFSKKEREDALRTHKDSLQQQQKDQENQLDKTHREAQSYEVRKFRRQKLIHYHGLEQDLLLEELSKRQAQLEYEHQMLLRHHESTQDLEYKHQAATQKLKIEHMKKQHETELANQKEYNQSAEAELRKKHSVEHKQQPRSLKQKELQIRKQFHEAVKTQERQYKALKEHVLMSTPRPEQKAVVKKLKEEQMRKLAILGEQYEQSISDMLQQQNVRLDETQVAEANELRQRLLQELELLTAYQSKIKMQTEAQHQRERKALEDRVSLRRALLEQKMDEERVKYQEERARKLKELHERQARRIEEFDRETVEMGLNAAEIAEASHDSFGDEDSVRGSVLSLSTSSSTSSFGTHTAL